MSLAHSFQSSPPASPSATSFARNTSFMHPVAPTSPTKASFLPSSTHAGGIQPSSSFFRPARPSQQPQYSRPSSVASSTNDAVHDVAQDPEQSFHHDAYPLEPVAASPRRHSITHSSIDEGATVQDSFNASEPRFQQFNTLKRVKQSREPLLPIGGPVSPRRPSVTAPRHDRAGQILPTPLSPIKSGSTSNISASRAVRTSLEKVWNNLGRGMSFDSFRRRSTSSRNEYDAAATDVATRKTFESNHRVIDEERAEGGVIPLSQSQHHRKISTFSAQERPTSPFKRTADSSSPFQLLSSHSDAHPPSPSPSPYHPSPSPTPSSSQHSPSPTPTFIPVPPPSTEQPPLIRMPLYSSKGKPVRRYERHASRNRFFFNGHLLTGGDSPWAFIASFGILVVLAGIWFGTTCVWWWRHVTPAVPVIGAYMALIVASSMLTTAFTDPGILPRDLDPDPPYPPSSPGDGTLRAPMPRDLKVRDEIVRVKYCPTCRTYRPPRSSHCKMCDNCVDLCDHHCQWINNCVGRRNYTTFFALLLSATLTLILVICTSAFHLYLLTRRDHIKFRHALSSSLGVGSAIAFCLAIVVIWPVSALLAYHVRLLLLNVTTIEQIRNQAHRDIDPKAAPPNPFSLGSWWRNFAAALCKPPGYSWLDAAGAATEDKRRINPGMLSAGGAGAPGLQDGGNQDEVQVMGPAFAPFIRNGNGHGHGALDREKTS